MINHDIAVIGGGPAGMAAAVAAYDSGVTDVCILEREEMLGGILKQCIHNGFGLHKLGRELTGPEYAAVYAEKVEERGIKTYCETMVTDISSDKTVTAQSTAGLLKIKAKAIILAMGCRERSRGALNTAGTRPAGVYSAGTAQKLMNCEGYSVGKKVVILGSGDIGLIMARRMSLEGAKVEAVCELMPYSGGLTRNIVQCLEDFGIPLRLSCTVVSTHGKDRLEGVTVANVDEHLKPIPGTEEYIPCDTLMLSVGLIPENELSKNAGIELDRITNGPIVDEYRETKHKGVFACGNVLQVHDLVDYVTEESQLAGAGAAKYIRGEKNCDEFVNTKGENGVRYIVPQRISHDTDKDVKLYFRVGRVLKNVTLTITCNGEVIYTKKKKKMCPGEMEYVPIKADIIHSLPVDSTMVVSVKEDA